jgi:hypothetical protein
MAKQRKTKDEWHLETNYGYGWEVECVEETWLAASEQARCYRANTTAQVRIRKRRVRIGLRVNRVDLLTGLSKLHIDYTQDGALYIDYTQDGATHNHYWRMAGTAKDLSFGIYVGETPIGILLDRLEECPEEVEGCPVELVREAVQWLRTKGAG